jgi:hypothetical protein
MEDNINKLLLTLRNNIKKWNAVFHFDYYKPY